MKTKKQDVSKKIGVSRLKNTRNKKSKGPTLGPRYFTHQNH